MQTNKTLSLFSSSIVFTAMASSCYTAHATVDSADAGTDATAEYFETITVSGTRTSREINEVAATVTQIGQEQIDRMAATNIRDILRFEPGVSVEGNGRFGLSGFNIRGINGDRVLILLDGVPVADEFSFGPNLSSRRDFVDIDLLESVEIVRGPASTLYGSDAIGGVVAFTSKSPNSLLEDGESSSHRVKVGYDSQSDLTSLNLLSAGGQGDWQWLVNAGSRDGSEFETFFTDDDTLGAERKSANPQSTEDHSILASLIYSPSDEHRIRLVADYQQRETSTELLNEANTVSRGVGIIDSRGEDEQDRQRFMATYTMTPTGMTLKRLNVDVFHQSSETYQQTFSSRLSLGSMATSSRTRESFFEQDSYGINIQADHEFSGAGDHYLIYGAQYQLTDSKALRLGETIDDATGTTLREFSVFPARDFPVSELTELALFIQDEWTLLDGALTISPGIRYDQFELTPKSDAIFENANPGVNIVGIDESELSKKIGAIYQLTDEYSIWAQYAEGFRIPPMDDINVGFTNFAGGYTSIPNPNLEPESVDSWEIGLRAQLDAIDFSISAYKNDYQNFIESRVSQGFDPERGLLVFQSQNLEEVSIEGIDAQFTWFMGESIDALENLQFSASTSLQSSEDKNTGEDIESILPTQTVTSIQYLHPEGTYSIRLAATYTEKAPSINLDGQGELFRAPSHTLIDLMGSYNVNKQLTINLGLYNITDKRYWLASEVRGLPVDQNNDRFTAPGRTFSANAIYRF